MTTDLGSETKIDSKVYSDKETGKKTGRNRLFSGKMQENKLNGL